jgi:gliding motility-associated-like protein
VADPIAAPSATTVYTVALTDQWGCRNTDQVTVTVYDKPDADAGPDQILEFVFEAVLAANEVQTSQTGEWKVLGGTGTFSDKNDNNAMVTDLSLGENKLVWSVTNGFCPASSDTLLIRVRELLIPSLITPNLDGKNDFFIIRGIESLGITGLDIFNRWGSNVYYSRNYKNDWDGRDMEGSPLPDDTYFYLLKPEKTVPVKGFVVIKR